MNRPPSPWKGFAVFSPHTTVRIAVVSAAAATAALVGVAAPTGAHAANGVFLYQTTAGQQSIPFPGENQCYPTKGAMGGMNYTAGDAYVYTDDHCTIGKDAGNIPRFDKTSVEFNSVVIRTSAQ